MMKMRQGTSVLATVLVAYAAASSPAVGQDEEKKLGWFNETEFSLAMVGGNAESENFALRNTLRRVWESSLLTLTASGLRTEKATISRAAIGTPDSFRVETRSESELTAEKYDLHGRFERNRTERLFWFAGGGWQRNEFAGFSDRLTAFGGVGNTWFDEGRAWFKTDYALTYTSQNDLVERPDSNDSFLGLRFSWDYARGLTETADYANVLVIDGNVDETSDYRADMVNSLSVAMSERLALKVSLQLLYDNQPALTSVPLLGADGSDSGATVLVPLDELDTILTMSLVVDF